MCLFIPAILLTKRKPLEISFASQYKDVSGYVVTCMLLRPESGLMSNRNNSRVCYKKVHFAIKISAVDGLI
jgi:hypothetical protein